MLSNPSSSIANRRQQHRRQNSTPTAFEAPNVRPLPAAIHNQRKPLGHRRGMSLDQRPTYHGQYQDHMSFHPGPFPQDDISVSMNTNNPGQFHPQHPMQVAQQHRPAQPGQPQEQHQQQQQAAHQHQEPQFQPQQGQIPQHMQQQQQPQQQGQPQQHQSLEPLSIPNLGPSQQPPHLSPTVQLSPSGGLAPPRPQLSPGPSEQQLKELEEHIKSVYGSMGASVYVNILPSPVAAPQKFSSADNLDSATLPAGSLNDITDISLDPPSGGYAMSSQPGSDQGFDGSTCYSPSGFSHRSPSSSPRQRHMQTFLEDVEEMPLAAPVPHLHFSDSAPLLSSPLLKQESSSSFLSASPSHSSPRAMSIADLSLDASIEDTGITAEEISAYISEQDGLTHRWTCLFPDCGKTFGRRENIRSHVQTHLGDRQFRCNGCGKCFVRQHDLKRHAKIHTGDKPYRCPCGGGFARQDALTRHRQRGMCIGGFPGVTRAAKARGRPRKKRPELEERVDKAARTRRAVAARTRGYASSVSGASLSDGSDGMSPMGGGVDFNNFDSAPLHDIGDEHGSDPFSLDEPSNSPLASTSPVGHHASDYSSPFDMHDGGHAQAGAQQSDTFDLHDFSQGHVEEDSLFDDLTNSSSAADVSLGATGLSQHDLKRLAQTPPHSPTVKVPGSGASSSSTAGPLPEHDGGKSPSHRSADSAVSNAFTTPPTSPLCGAVGAEEFAAFGGGDGGMDMGMSMFGDASAFGVSVGSAGGGSAGGEEALAARMAWFEAQF